MIENNDLIILLPSDLSTDNKQARSIFVSDKMNRPLFSNFNRSICIFFQNLYNWPTYIFSFSLKTSKIKSRAIYEYPFTFLTSQFHPPAKMRISH